MDPLYQLINYRIIYFHTKTGMKDPNIKIHLSQPKSVILVLIYAQECPTTIYAGKTTGTLYANKPTDTDHCLICFFHDCLDVI